MSFEPTEDMKAAYYWARLPPDTSIITNLADLAQHAMAAALKASNPHHDFDWSHWLKLADKKLREDVGMNCPCCADLRAEIAKLKLVNADEHAKAEHYRNEAANVYLANEDLQEEVAKLKAERNQWKEATIRANDKTKKK